MIKASNTIDTSYTTSLADHCATKLLPSTTDAAELKDLILLVAEAATQIREQVARGELVRLAGDSDNDSLIEFARDVFSERLSGNRLVGVLAINGCETKILSDHAEAKYAILIDPLDGSVNRSVNLSVGTIFSIYQRPASSMEPEKSWALQPGKQAVAAGYVLYGSATMMVFTAGERVDAFTYDAEPGEFLLSHQNIHMPWQGKYYSVNDGYRQAFPAAYQHFLAELRSGDSGTRYSCRYSGTLVADFHRTLLMGGVFAYPPNDDQPGGKLKLQFQVNPIAMLASVAGGVALDGTRNVLAIAPKHLDQRSTFVVGGKAEMELFVRHARNPDALVYRTRMRVA